MSKVLYLQDIQDSHLSTEDLFLLVIRILN